MKLQGADIEFQLDGVNQNCRRSSRESDLTHLVWDRGQNTFFHSFPSTPLHLHDGRK